MTDAGQKQCTKCGETKPVSDFHLNYGKPRNACKVCLCKQVREYTSLNKEKVDERNRKRYEENRDAILSKMKERHKVDPSLKKEANKIYSLKPKNRARIVWHKAKLRHSGDPSTLIPLEKVQEWMDQGRCQRSGIPFDLNTHEKYYRHPFAPSIDKINPFGDYTTENVQLVCNAYNGGKNQMTDDEFVEFCRLVVAFNDQGRT